VASLVAPKSQEKGAFNPAGFPLLSGLKVASLKVTGCWFQVSGFKSSISSFQKLRAFLSLWQIKIRSFHTILSFLRK
jgi:hypothetical protein